MPAEVMSATVSVVPNPCAQAFGLAKQLLARHPLEILVHVTSPLGREPISHGLIRRTIIRPFCLVLFGLTSRSAYLDLLGYGWKPETAKLPTKLARDGQVLPVVLGRSAISARLLCVGVLMPQ